MPTPTVAQLENEVRLITDRVNDPTLTSATIVSYLCDGLRSMYDLFLDSVPHWVESQFEFTLVGDSEATSLVALPDDFQIDLGLDWLNPPGLTYPVTIRRLPTFLDRNRLNPSNALALSSVYGERNYGVQGSVLQLYPKQNCGGNYRLYYQIQIPALALPATRTFAVAGSDQPGTAGPGPSNAWLLANAAFTSADIGGTLTPAFDAPNLAWNIPFTITDVFSSTAAAVTPDPNAIGSFTQPPTGDVYSLVYQPANTIGALPQVFAPWQLYIKTFAAISVMTSFQEDTSTLQARLSQETARVKRMAEKRQSDLRQIPIIRGGRGIDSPNFDSGGGWGGGGDW